MLSITEAIVLKLVDYGEADRIVTLLTQEYGKISAIALGARRSHKRFGAALAPFGYGSAKLKIKQGNSLWILQELHGAQGFSHLSAELGRFSQASYASELCQELCSPHQPEPEVMQLLIEFLTHLNQLPLSQKPKLELARVFELKLLELVGLQLSLHRCVACGCMITDTTSLAIDHKQGGILCGNCASQQIHRSGVAAISASTHQLLSGLANKTFAEVELESYTKETSMECRRLMIDFIQYHLEKPLRTVEFALQF